jgi:hypothetical protein
MTYLPSGEKATDFNLAKHRCVGALWCRDINMLMAFKHFYLDFDQVFTHKMSCVFESFQTV